MPGQWAGSDRRTTLPPDWDTRRLPILKRDLYQCTWIGDLNEDGRPHDYITAAYSGIAHQIVDRCQSRATDVDHIDNPHDHGETNLRSLCSWHHDRRSSRQGNAAMNRLRAQLRLPTKPHPGLLR